MIKPMQDFVLDGLRELMTVAAADIARAVFPIYFKNRRDRAEHLGSCVLIKWKSHHLIITAAHVTDADKTSFLYIPVQGRLRRLDGSVLATVAPNDDRDRDHFDFSVIKMPTELVNTIGNVRFVQENELQMQVIPRGHAFMAFGFPNSRNKLIDHKQKTIRPRRFSYGGPLTLAHESDRDLTNQIDQHSLRMKYDKRSQTFDGVVVNSIEPRGISGGGLFDLGTLVTAVLAGSFSSSAAKLAGILIERRRKEREIVATKISTIIEVYSRSLLGQG